MRPALADPARSSNIATALLSEGPALSLTLLRELDLAARPGFLSAASGLIRAGDTFHVIADDALFLASFAVGKHKAGSLMRLLPGTLPADSKERKKKNPDFEALVKLPAGPDWPHGALLAMGSGSRPNRRRGALIVLQSDGSADSARPVDLTALLEPLDSHFSETNIESAVLSNGNLILLQRGNGENSWNALVIHPASVIDAFVSGAILPEPTIHRVELGASGGVPLSITDAAVLPNGNLLVSAVAEDTPNAYLDGPLTAACLAEIDLSGRLLRVASLEPTVKVEGIHAELEPDGSLAVFLVTDGDDPTTAARLYQTRWTATRPFVQKTEP